MVAAMSDQKDRVSFTFPLPATPSEIPKSGPSGGVIKAAVIRAIEEQQKVEQEASNAIDHLIARIRKYSKAREARK